MARIFNAVRAENTLSRRVRGDFKQALKLIDNAITFYQDEFGQIHQIQSGMADRVEVLHKTGDEVRDTAVTITDEKAVSGLAAMYDALQTNATSRPIPGDCFLLTFYQRNRELWTWWIAPWEDNGRVITANSLKRGTYMVKNGFDFERLAELLEGQQTEARNGLAF